jgi:hypothetical protein
MGSFVKTKTKTQGGTPKKVPTPRAPKLPLKLKVEKALREHDISKCTINDCPYCKAKKHLSRGWGGNLRAGGGWSSPWLTLFEILEGIK